MDRSDVLTLIKTSKAQNEYGVWDETRTHREVFCRVDSVTRSEFFDGGRNGLNPEYRFTIFFGDYEGEHLCEYRGQSYAIYRTYHGKTDVMELYVERKGGTNGKENPA